MVGYLVEDSDNVTLLQYQFSILSIAFKLIQHPSLQGEGREETLCKQNSSALSKKPLTAASINMQYESLHTDTCTHGQMYTQTHVHTWTTYSTHVHCTHEYVHCTGLSRPVSSLAWLLDPLSPLNMHSLYVECTYVNVYNVHIHVYSMYACVQTHTLHIYIKMHHQVRPRTDQDYTHKIQIRNFY